MYKKYIKAKCGFKVHTTYIAKVKRNLGLPIYDAPNAAGELKRLSSEKVETIKDALIHFGMMCAGGHNEQQNISKL